MRLLASSSQARAAAAAGPGARRAPAAVAQLHVQRRGEQQRERRRLDAAAASCSGASSSGSRSAGVAAAGSRRGALLGLGALAAALAGAPRGARAADGAAQAGALEEYMGLESKGKLKDRKQLDDFRARFAIRRGLDGRVQLRSRKGEWHSVRLDMEVPGALLLRDTKGGVYAIETEGLPQVDLSDDYVLLMLFADGSWQDNMQPIEYEDADTGKVQQLTMSDAEFREFIGILKDEEDDAGDKDKRRKK
ncbi:MAG: hypothetical protein J3K34DRAFT_130462 [Monoraphidium minutum]|nr:MAG: hypothetical protein J3K34DRAFT_130462 [Monoraphidium minutum]